LFRNLREFGQMLAQLALQGGDGIVPAYLIDVVEIVRRCFVVLRAPHGKMHGTFPAEEAKTKPSPIFSRTT
jgi:hypothetical protein